MKKPRYTIPEKHKRCRSIKELAAALGASYQTFREYSALGILPRQKNGLYYTKAVCDWLEEAKGGESDEEMGDASAELEKLRRVKRQREELKLRQERGELVHVDDIRALMRDMLGFWRARAKTAGGRIGMKMAGSGVDDIREAVDAEMWAIGKEMDKWAESQSISTAGGDE